MIQNNQQEETDPRFFPMLAFEGASATADFGAAWVVFKTLSRETKGVLVSSAMPMKMRLLVETFSVSDENIVKVSAAIRELFFAKHSIDECAAIITELATEHRDWVVSFLKEEILAIVPEPDEDEIAAAEAAKAAGPTSDKLSLLAALGKYARLGEQAITASRLSLKGNPEPVRGNLVNWLKVYRDELGVGYHDPVLRAKFLFNSPNAKGITSEERERLNLILRSVEENAPLDIDTTKLEIVFPSFAVTESRPAPVQRVATVPAPMSRPFIPTPTPSPVSPRPFVPTPTSSPAPTPKPVSVPAPRPAAHPFVAPSIPKPVPVSVAVSAPVSVPASKPVSASGSDGVPDFSPVPAPKRQTSAPASFTIRPTLRHDEDGDGFSFSSKHSFQAERSGEGGMSINHPAKGALPSGQAFFKKSAPVLPIIRTTPASPVAPSPVPLVAPKPIAQAPLRPATPKANPFQIRPRSLEERGRDDDMGRIVDLRNEG